MAEIKTFDRGSTILQEVTFTRSQPFADDIAFNPTSPQITVTDADGTIKVNAAAMTQHATGQYYYIIQTTTAWILGLYTVKVTAVSGSYSDITIVPGMFRLV